VKLPRKWPRRESDLGPPVVEWLREQGYDVYQEVEMHQGGPRADIVGVRGQVLFVVELKKSLSLDVIAQAAYWRRYAHFAAVAVPARVGKMFGRRILVTDDQGRGLAGEVLAWKGLGLLEVLPPGHDGHLARLGTSEEGVVQLGNVEGPRETMPAPLHRRIAEGLRAALKPQQRTFAKAGNADAKRWTKFRETAARLRRYVDSHPRCTLKQAIGGISHHYASDASARGALVRLLREGVVKGVALNPHTMTLHRPDDAEGLALRKVAGRRGVATLELFELVPGSAARRG